MLFAEGAGASGAFDAMRDEDVAAGSFSAGAWTSFKIAAMEKSDRTDLRQQMRTHAFLE